VIIVADRIFQPRFELEKYVPREQRFAEDHCLAAVFVNRVVTGQGGRYAVAGAILHEFLLSTRTGMGNKPTDL
jgi:hypothetical protein